MAGLDHRYCFRRGGADFSGMDARLPQSSWGGTKRMVADRADNFHPSGLCLRKPGLGSASCGAACTAINLSLIGLGTATSYRIYRGQSIGWFLIPMVILGLTTHCVRSTHKHNLARPPGWLLADLQYGAPDSDTLFCSSFEGCANTGQRSNLRCAVWNDRFHGCGQSAV